MVRMQTEPTPSWDDKNLNTIFIDSQRKWIGAKRNVTSDAVTMTMSGKRERRDSESLVEQSLISAACGISEASFNLDLSWITRV